MAVNDELESLRLRATSSLLSGRRDIIVVASVSCIYGIGNPTEYANGIIRISKGDIIVRNTFLHKLVQALYNRTTIEFDRGMFRVKGDTVDVNLPYAEYGIRIIFFGDEIEEIQKIEISTGKKIESVQDAAIFPANMYIAPQDQMKNIVDEIYTEMLAQEEYFKNNHQLIEAQRIKERVLYDLEMIQELGYCKGIENYSRFLDRRQPGSRPFCLLDYFPNDYLMLIDESHVTLPQIRAMYGGDLSRKQNLVEYGFRLTSALDNRPLKFEEFKTLQNQTIYISATPSNYELEQAEGVVVEQLIRPTGILDPIIELKPVSNQVDDLLEEIHKTIEKDERVLVTTLTKRMAEELSKYLSKLQVRCRYIHSEVETLERIEILRQLRVGMFDVLIGINLLREGLDLPEVSLVAILDADKEGFLRNTTSLVQTVGRAARNVNGRVIMYADKITDSIKFTIDETERRRKKQIEYNYKNKVTPVQAGKKALLKPNISDTEVTIGGELVKVYQDPILVSMAAEPDIKYNSAEEIKKKIVKVKTAMTKAAKEMDFILAAKLRDEMYELEKQLITWG